MNSAAAYGEKEQEPLVRSLEWAEEGNWARLEPQQELLFVSIVSHPCQSSLSREVLAPFTSFDDG